MTMLDFKIFDNFLSENLQEYYEAKSDSSEELNEILRILEKHENKIKEHLVNLDEKNSLRCKSPRSINSEITQCGLTLNEIQRYSRQLILPEFRVSGQLKTKNASVLIVGAGGLGCPAALYLAACGIGRIGIVDGDTIDKSNLHRQVAHKETKIGKCKVDSLSQAITDLNSEVIIVKYKSLLSSNNAAIIFNEGFDVILDATDNPATRYLINDACQLCDKPLVSGSALRWEGQLTVYNYPPGKGPTYRCLFPDPPNPETVTNCSDGGVIGVVTGVIGCLQALEAIKIILNDRECKIDMKMNHNFDILSGTMLIFDAISSRFRHIKLRPRREEASQVSKLIDYEMFCQSRMNDKTINKSESSITFKRHRISVENYSEWIDMKKPHILIDVRTEPEVEICSLDSSINIPLDTIQSVVGLNKISKLIEEQNEIIDARQETHFRNETHVVLVCRRGNDSQIARQILEEYFNSKTRDNKLIISDIIGGLEAWANRINGKFPKY